MHKIKSYISNYGETYYLHLTREEVKELEFNENGETCIKINRNCNAYNFPAKVVGEKYEKTSTFTRFKNLFTSKG